MPKTEKPDAFKQQLLSDLETHFVRRVELVISDISSTCSIAECQPIDAIKLVMSGLLFELMRISVVLQFDEEEFLTTTRIAYRTMMQDAVASLQSSS